MSQRINLKKLWKLNNNQYPLLGTSANLSQFPFMAGYLTDYRGLDRNLAIHKGFFEPIWNMDDEETESAVLTQFREDATNVIKKHAVELAQLFKINSVDYDPISNYDKISEITIEHTGTITDENDYGAQTNGATKGQQIDTNAFGATQKTDQFGAQSNSTTIGAVTTTDGQHTDTETKQIDAAFSGEGFDNADKTTYENGSIEHATTAQSNSESIGTHTDTSSELAHTDTITSGSRSDSETLGAHKDTLEKTFENTDTTTEHTSGNIGVTTATAMLTEHKEFWTNYNFYDTLFNIIVRELCVYNDPGVSLL